jgi:hypothetical protein
MLLISEMPKNCSKCDTRIKINLGSFICAGLIMIVPLVSITYLMVNEYLNPLIAIPVAGVFSIIAFVISPYIIEIQIDKSDK